MPAAPSPQHGAVGPGTILPPFLSSPGSEQTGAGQDARPSTSLSPGERANWSQSEHGSAPSPRAFPRRAGSSSGSLQSVPARCLHDLHPRDLGKQELDSSPLMRRRGCGDGEPGVSSATDPIARPRGRGDAAGGLGGCGCARAARPGELAAEEWGAPRATKVPKFLRSLSHGGP